MKRKCKISTGKETVEHIGRWKDTALRLEGEAVWELSRLFLTDYGINVKGLPHTDFELYPENESSASHRRRCDRCYLALLGLRRGGREVSRNGRVRYGGLDGSRSPRQPFR